MLQLLQLLRFVAAYCGFAAGCARHIAACCVLLWLIADHGAEAQAACAARNVQFLSLFAEYCGLLHLAAPVAAIAAHCCLLRLVAALLRLMAACRGAEARGVRGAQRAVYCGLLHLAAAVAAFAVYCG